MSSKNLKSSLEFSFRQRFGKINWDQIMHLDIESILNNSDIESLQSVIENLTYSTLDREDLEKFSNPNAVKVFKLSQLAIEYLMGIQNHSQEAGNSYILKQKKLYEENSHLKETLKLYSEEIESLKTEYLEKRKRIKIQEAVFKQPGIAAKLNKSVTRDNAVPCDNCSKIFTNYESLEQHRKRRHTINESMDSAKTSDFAPMFELMKTFTEQKIQLISEANKSGVESLKELLKLQIEIQSQKEAQYFETFAKLLKDHQSVMQEEKAKSMLMEIKLKKEKLNEDYEEDLRRAHDSERKLKMLKEEHEMLLRDLEDKQKNYSELMSHDNSINEIFETEERIFIERNTLGESRNVGDKEVGKRLDTPPPQILKKANEERDQRFGEVEVHMKVEKREAIENLRTVSLDEDNFEIPVLIEKTEIIYPTYIKESNAGDLISDSSSGSNTPRPISNCGEILSDSEQSSSRSFVDSKLDKSSISISSKPVFVEEAGSIEIIQPKRKESDSVSDISEKSQKLVPRELNREEIAKILGINPKLHSKYLFIVDRFLQAPLPEPWQEHVQDDGTYFITPSGEVSVQNPKIPYFTEYFRDLKDRHYRISDKIHCLTREIPVQGLKVTSHFVHKNEDFLVHRDKLQDLYVFSEKPPKREVKVGKKDLRNKKKLVETLCAGFMNNKVEPPEPVIVSKPSHSEQEEQYF
jgi:hypothetical protein